MVPFFSSSPLEENYGFKFMNSEFDSYITQNFVNKTSGYCHVFELKVESEPNLLLLTL